MAMMLKPALLVADEPTTALDVTVQAKILELLVEVTAETGSGLLLITHDMGVVAEVADRVMVMRQGRIIESRPAADLFDRPAEAYSRALLAAVPRLDGVGVATLPAGTDPVLRLSGVSGSHFDIFCSDVWADLLRGGGTVRFEGYGGPRG